MEIFGRKARKQGDRLAADVAALEQAMRQQKDWHAQELATLRETVDGLASEGARLGADLAALLETVRALKEQYADAEEARRETTLALQRIALREADITDLRRRHAELVEENARLTDALPGSVAPPDMALDNPGDRAGNRTVSGEDNTVHPHLDDPTSAEGLPR